MLCMKIRRPPLAGHLDGRLYYFDVEALRFERHLEGIGVRTIYEHEPGRFWLGTGNDGLIEYAPEQGILRSF